MHIGQIIFADSANGIGIRVSLFVSGCTNCCPDCFQKETWDFNFGQLFTKEIEDKIIEELKKPYYDGITLLGGEPFEMENQKGLLPLIRRIKKELPSKTIWAYTGFLYEDLIKNGKRHIDITDEILDSIDILVDGRFILSKYNISLNFRGSENQRIIDIKKTRKEGKIILSSLND